MGHLHKSNVGSCPVPYVSETTKFSSYLLLYNRDVILPLDNILRPCRVYYGEEHHEIAREEMHRPITLVRNNIRKARKKAIEGSRSKTKDVKFKVGDLVYYKNHHKRRKLDVRWRPYYVVIENTGPVSYRITDQLTGSVTNTHAEHLRAASNEEWEIPTTDRPLRKIALAAPIDSSDSDTDSETEKAEFSVHKCRHRRENSDDESGVPLMERRIVTRHRTADKSVSTCDIERITGFSPTSKDETPEDGESESTRGERVVNDDFLVGQTSAGSRRDDALAGRIGERTAGENVWLMLVSTTGELERINWKVELTWLLRYCRRRGLMKEKSVEEDGESGAEDRRVRVASLTWIEVRVTARVKINN